MSQETYKVFKYFTPLAMMAAVIGVTAGDLLHYIINIRPFLFNAGSFVTPVFFFFLDVIAEVYGYKNSKIVIISYLFCAVVHAILVSAIVYIPSAYGHDHMGAFSWVFGTTVFAFLFATVGIIAGMFLNAFYLTKWKFLCKGRYFGIRSVFSSAIGEFTQLFVFSIAAVFIYHPAMTVLKMVVSIYCLRVCCAIVFAYPGTIITSFLKHIEKVDESSVKEKIQFNNPFK